MDKQGFLRYLRNEDMHDATVQAVTRLENELRVVVRTADGRLLVFEFNDVRSLKMHRPEGMVLYSLTEMNEPPPYRKFVFTNWDEEDDACLEILAGGIMEVLEESENPIGSLVGQELSGLVFVRDYIQLQFADRGLTAVTLPTVASKGGTYLSGMPGYRDSLCERIGHIVVDARMREDEGIELKFDDGSVISISLKREDYIGPEAAIFHDGSQQTWVW